MVYEIAQRLTGKLQKTNRISSCEYEKFVYVIESDIEALITLTSIMIISVVIGNVIQTLCFLIFFFMLRKRMGGFHLKKYWQCYIGTLCIYVFISHIMENAHNYREHIVVMTIFAALIIIYIGGMYHPNLQLTKDEKDDLKVMSRVTCGIQLVIILFLDWLNIFGDIMLYLCMAVVLCAILLLLTPLSRSTDE